MRTAWLALAAAGAWWCAAHLGPTGRLAVADPIRYVPLAGEELFDKVTPTQCLPHLDELVTHPHWSIGVTTGWWGCLGYDDHGTYEIHSDGKVDHHWLGMTRTLELTAGELALVEKLGQFDCTTDEPGGFSLTVSVGAPSLDGGVRFSSESPVGDRLDDLLEDAVAQYVAERQWALSDATLHVRTGKLRVDLRGRTLRVRRGRHVLATRTLDPESYVNMLDAIVLGAVPAVDEPAGTGVVHLDGVTYTFDLLSWWDGGALAPITRVLNDARP